MASWDHRAATGSATYQLYLYVTETSFNTSGVGITQLNAEVGLIKVASSNGFRTFQNSTPWEIHMHGNNNGDTSGTGGFDFPAGDPIGTRRAIGSVSGWTFSHNPNYDGRLSLNTMARIDTGTPVGDPQIGWGLVTMTALSRDGAAPAVPILLSRDSDTQVTIRAYDSTDWGLGTGALLHNLDKADVSNMSALLGSTSYPTTGGGAAHSVVQSVTAHKTFYFRGALQGRNGVWKIGSILTVYGRPSIPPVPEVSAKTTTSITLSTAAPTYTGGTITDRETVLLANDGVTVLQTSTHLTAPAFTSLTRVTAYKSKTRVKSDAGWSDWSGLLSVTTPGTPPSAPTGYSVYDIAATSFKVATGSIADNGGGVPLQTRVKVSTTASDVGLVQTITLPQWAPVRVSGLTENTAYWVAEAAFNGVEGGGWGPYGPWVPLVTKNTVPNAPTLSLLSAAGDNVTLQWVAPTDLNGATIVAYRLLVGTNEALTANLQSFSTVSLSQVITGLTPATQYFASIWTETDQGLGSSSAVLSFSTTGGGGATSGVWLDIAGVPTFCEVWVSGEDGIPKLAEVWHSGDDGVPKVCTS